MHLLALLFLFGQTRHRVEFKPDFTVEIGTADTFGMQLIVKALKETKTPYLEGESLAFLFWVRSKDIGSFIGNLGGKLAKHHRHGTLQGNVLLVENGDPFHE
jgi:hypothetical protein